MHTKEGTLTQKRERYKKKMLISFITQEFLQLTYRIGRMMQSIKSYFPEDNKA